MEEAVDDVYDDDDDDDDGIGIAVGQRPGI